MDLKKLIEFHKNKKSLATISLVTNDDPSSFGSVVLKDDKILDFVEKSSEGEKLINRGVYVFEPRIFDYIEPDKNISIEKEIFPRLAKEGVLFGFRDEGSFIDIGKPETYHKFKEDNLNNLLLSEANSVRDALQKISWSEVNIILIVNSEKKLLGVLTDRAIKRFLLSGGGLDDSVDKAMIKDPTIATTSDSQAKISEFLFKGINSLPILDENGRVVDVKFREEKARSESFPVLRGRAPLRISFAGGGTDLAYYFEEYGGAVINATIDKYCYATIVKRADKKIIIDSDVTPEKDVVVQSIDDLKYDGKFDLIKSVIRLMSPDFGFELYLNNDIPPGRGLGSSASLAVLMVSLLSNLQGIKYDDYKIAELAYKAEREELGIKGGWQDQYASVTGGFNFMEFSKDKTLIYPLRLKEEIINELNSHLLLCYVGKSHSSGEVHKNQEEVFKKDEDVVNNLNKIKELAFEIRDSLLTNKLDKFGEILHESWINKRKLSQSTTNSSIDGLYEMGLKNGAVGGRLLGAGNGGYILFFISPKKRNQLTKELINKGIEIMNFNFDFKGTQVWPVNSKI
ncbi:MAG: sugar phosphate nucleotidyltransferase [Nanoarchaeota archaeon]